MAARSDLRSPLGRALGLGSAKEGVGHWWAQRLSAVALVPLGLWFVASVIGLVGADHAAFSAWVASPFTTAMLVILIAVTFHHTWLGLQVVVEDYVHLEWAKMALLILIRFAAVLLAVTGTLAVLRIAFGA